MTVLPESPYKGLAAFEDSEVDALLFFGREREVEAAATNVLANRLTVLFGPSGVGKSSLLRAGVARRLREMSGAPVVVHDAWAEDPAGALVASVRAECGELGPTAGLVDTIAAAAQRYGEVHLLLDQFEEYVLYHGSTGPLGTALPELLRRPGLRVNVLLAIRDDALAELDEFTGRIPDLFANLLRLERLSRAEGRAAILGPLARYSELSGTEFTAEEALVEAVLDEATTENGVEAPYLQLVLERLWEQERDDGSHELRLATLQRIGGSRAVVHDHVYRALKRLSAPEQEATTRVMRQLVTPSGRKVSHEAADLAEYAGVDPSQLRDLLGELGRLRIVRAVDGTAGAATRWEIFHDVLGPPLLSWQREQQLRTERAHTRRLRVVAAASLVGLVLVALLAIFALIQRSHAQTQARLRAGRELAARALVDLATDPQTSVGLALRAARLAPGQEAASVLRSSLLAMREERILRLGGTITTASFAPRGRELLVTSSSGKLGTYDAKTGRFHRSHLQGPITAATWGLGGRVFVTGSASGQVFVWGSPGNQFRMGSAVKALAYEHATLLAAAGDQVRLENERTGGHLTVAFKRKIETAVLSPNGAEFAVAFVHGTKAKLVDAHTGRTIRVLAEKGIHSFAFSPDGSLLATGSYDHNARLWNSTTGQLLFVLRHSGYVLQESFSRDGRRLVTSSSDGAAYVWSVATGQRQLLLVGATGAIESAAFSPDGSEIVTGSADRFARLYNATDGRLLAPLAGATDAVTSVAFDPSGRTVVAASKDGTARLFDAEPAGTLRTIDTRKGPVLAFWLGKHPVTVAGRVAQELTTSGHVLHKLKAPSPIVATASQGNHFAFLLQNGTVATDWGPIPIVRVSDKSRFTAIAFEPHGALVTGAANGEVDFGQQKAVQTGAPVLGIYTGSDRVLIRSATELRVYTDGGELVSTIHAATDHATISPDGLTLATSKVGVAELWDATTGKPLHTLDGHSAPITALAFSPDGTELVTASFDHRGIVWNTGSGRLIHRLIGHFFPIYAVSWSADGRWIATASQFTAGLWNAENGQLMFYLGRTAAPLTGAAFSPTGDWILTGSKDGTARLYDCQVCAPLGALERLAASRLRALQR